MGQQNREYLCNKSSICNYHFKPFHYFPNYCYSNHLALCCSVSKSGWPLEDIWWQWTTKRDESCHYFLSQHPPPLPPSPVLSSLLLAKLFTAPFSSHFFYPSLPRSIKATGLNAFQDAQRSFPTFPRPHYEFQVPPWRPPGWTSLVEFSGCLQISVINFQPQDQARTKLNFQSYQQAKIT